MSRLGEKLRELRGKHSLLEVERGTGISRIEVSRYEQGKYSPSPKNLEKLALYYELPYGDLRILYYDDLLKDTREREIVLRWAKQYL
jgi:transcriptional regulator with XRE-family HTH domain